MSDEPREHTASAAPLTLEQQRRVEAALPSFEPLARAFARRLASHREDDLMQSAREALLGAARRYDAASGVPFLAFAFPRVRGAMVDALRADNRLVRTHARAVRDLTATQALLDAAADTEGVTVDPRASLRERVEAAARRVERASAALLCTRFAEVESEAIAAPTPPDPEAHIDQRRLLSRLRGALEQLPSADRELLRAIYEHDTSMGELAAAQGVHKSSISRRHARVLADLAATMRALAAAERTTGAQATTPERDHDEPRSTARVGDPGSGAAPDGESAAP